MSKAFAKWRYFRHRPLHLQLRLHCKVREFVNEGTVSKISPFRKCFWHGYTHVLMHKLLTHGVGRELREWTGASLTGIRQWVAIKRGDVGMQICCKFRCRGARTRGLSRSIAVGGGALAFFWPAAAARRGAAFGGGGVTVWPASRRGVTVKLSAPELYSSYFSSHIILYAIGCLFVTKINKLYVSNSKQRGNTNVNRHKFNISSHIVTRSAAFEYVAYKYMCRLTFVQFIASQY